MKRFHKMVVLLSTPHGALGTDVGKAKKLSHLSFNSTRCIRNLMAKGIEKERTFRLSTPHGALGTLDFDAALELWEQL